MFSLIVALLAQLRRAVADRRDLLLETQSRLVSARARL